MMRAVDCGNSYADNRLRTCDLRLLSGDLPVHSDPIIWHPDESLNSAAFQLQHTIFSVPQLSVRLETLLHSHIEMIKTYLDFWSDHREVICFGEFMPAQPQDMFPYALARNKDKLLIAVFANTVVRLPPELPLNIIFMNATNLDRIVLEASKEDHFSVTTACSLRGEVLEGVGFQDQGSLRLLNLPRGGYAMASKVPKVEKKR